jgi:hypothetical protein
MKSCFLNENYYYPLAQNGSWVFIHLYASHLTFIFWLTRRPPAPALLGIPRLNSYEQKKKIISASRIKFSCCFYGVLSPK